MIYEFSASYEGFEAQFIMTSVRGHMLNYAFPSNYKGWENVAPESLFSAPVSKVLPDKYNEDVKKTLQQESRKCAVLIIWTDCDREGENIGAEVRDVCLEAKPSLRVRRAQFSEITNQSITRALRTLRLVLKP